MVAVLQVLGDLLTELGVLCRRDRYCYECDHHYLQHIAIDLNTMGVAVY